MKVVMDSMKGFTEELARVGINRKSVRRKEKEDILIVFKRVE